MNTLKNKQLNNHIRTVSLFSGAGGLDIGAIEAGAKILWANDMKKEACDSYAQNIGEHIHRGDINDFFGDLSQLHEIDLLIGGPPCQGFSVAGKMDASDERSQLVWSYVRALEILKPQAFIMENVKALAALSRWAKVREQLMDRFMNLGYSVNYIVLNASDYDVPQARERVFFIGFKSDTQAIPNLENMLRGYSKKAPSVREALSILDKAGSGNNKSTCNAKITITPNPVLRKSPYAGMLFNGLGRPLKLDGYSATLPASMGGNKTPIIDENALYNYEKPWVESYRDELEKDVCIASKTEVPAFLRRLTVDEARVLQTFPMEYKFCGSQSAQFTQIGNAVPCNLAKAVCSMVIDVLTGAANIQYQTLF